MGDKSEIQWTDATWNPVVGCSKVSPGCAHCYAEDMTERFAETWGVPGLPWTPENALENVVLKPDRLDQPLRWKKPRMIFVNSMSDLFHERLTGLPTEAAETEEDVKRDLERFPVREGEPRRPMYIAEVFAVMSLAPQHTFQVLTKRPKAMAFLLGTMQFWLDVNAIRLTKYSRPVLPGGMSEYAAGTLTLPNVWLGTSIENRQFIERADWLKSAPAAVRFISAEPLLGPLVYDSVERVGSEAGGSAGPTWADDSEAGSLELAEVAVPVDLPADESVDAALAYGRRAEAAGTIPGIDWLIVGGESGPKHRPVREEWVRALRDAAQDAGTAFFFKQWGGRTPKAGGRELDGREWNEMPVTEPAQIEEAA